MDYKLYQSINSLPFKVFLDVLETNNLAALCISGTAPEDVLAETWDKLITAYFDALNSEDENGQIAEASDLAVADNKLTRARLLIDAIAKIGPHKTLLDEMRTFDYMLPDAQDKALQLFIANYKRDLVDMQVTLAQARGVEKQSTPLDAAYYLDTIAVIITNLKCSIDINSLTLGLYVALVKQYRVYCKSIEKLHANEPG